MALVAVAYIVPGVHVGTFWHAIIPAIVLGVVNAVIKPILVILSLPLQILTLGLFTFVINAVLFYFVAALNIGLSVSSFGAAFLGALALTVVSWILSAIAVAVEA